MNNTPRTLTEDILKKAKDKQASFNDSFASSIEKAVEDGLEFAAATQVGKFVIGAAVNKTTVGKTLVAIEKSVQAALPGASKAIQNKLFKESAKKLVKLEGKTALGKLGTKFLLKRFFATAGLAAVSLVAAPEIAAVAAAAITISTISDFVAFSMAILAFDKIGATGAIDKLTGNASIDIPIIGNTTFADVAKLGAGVKLGSVLHKPVETVVNSIVKVVGAKKVAADVLEKKAVETGKTEDVAAADIAIASADQAAKDGEVLIDRLEQKAIKNAEKQASTDYAKEVRAKLSSTKAEVVLNKLEKKHPNKTVLYQTIFDTAKDKNVTIKVLNKASKILTDIKNSESISSQKVVETKAIKSKVKDVIEGSKITDNIAKGKLKISPLKRTVDISSKGSFSNILIDAEKKNSVSIIDFPGKPLILAKDKKTTSKLQRLILGQSDAVQLVDELKTIKGRVTSTQLDALEKKFPPTKDLASASSNTVVFKDTSFTTATSNIAFQATQLINSQSNSKFIIDEFKKIKGSILDTDLVKIEKSLEKPQTLNDFAALPKISTLGVKKNKLVLKFDGPKADVTFRVMRKSTAQAIESSILKHIGSSDAFIEELTKVKGSITIKKLRQVEKRVATITDNTPKPVYKKPVVPMIEDYKIKGIDIECS